MTGFWRALSVLAGLAVLAATAAAQGRPAPPGPRAARPPETTQVNTKQASTKQAETAALQDFKTRLDQYLVLRAGLARKLGPLATTADSTQLATRQDALAAAIKSARASAQRGDLIPRLAALAIARTVRDDFNRRNPTAKLGVFVEVPATRGASLINKTYPAEDALPTMPPLLLGNLPKLPDNLQYRFAGRDVVILDGDVEVVIDYIPGVLPAPLLPTH